MKTLAINTILAIAICYTLLMIVVIQSQSIKAVTSSPPTVPTKMSTTNAKGAQQQITNKSSATSTSAAKEGMNKNVFHSKYVTVTKHSFRHGDLSDSITGTILNNSTNEVSPVGVSAALLDKNNKLIDMRSGSVDFSSLKPGEDSSFKIDLFSDTKDKVDHYILFVVATPKA
jgi:hypothetical protein